MKYYKEGGWISEKKLAEGVKLEELTTFEKNTSFEWL